MGTTEIFTPEAKKRVEEIVHAGLQYKGEDDKRLLFCAHHPPCNAPTYILRLLGVENTVPGINLKTSDGKSMDRELREGGISPVGKFGRGVQVRMVLDSLSKFEVAFRRKYLPPVQKCNHDCTILDVIEQVYTCALCKYGEETDPPENYELEIQSYDDGTYGLFLADKKRLLLDQKVRGCHATG